MDADQELLSGGNTSGAVVRVGQTIRKRWLPTSDRTVAYLAALRAKGIDAPAPMGRDERGRLVLECIPGELALHRAPLDIDTVARVGCLVRRIHDASGDLPVPADWEVLLPTPGPNLICHNDLATWNLIIDGERLVFIDWDGAGPSTRVWDLAYAAISFGHLFPDAPVQESCHRLTAFLDGYEADQELRDALPRALADRALAMYDLLESSHRSGFEPWASMFSDFHGKHWQTTSDHIRTHEPDWRRASRE